jgi:hypothetical protein
MHIISCCKTVLRQRRALLPAIAGFTHLLPKNKQHRLINFGRFTHTYLGSVKQTLTKYAEDTYLYAHTIVYNKLNTVEMSNTIIITGTNRP